MPLLLAIALAAAGAGWADEVDRLVGQRVAVADDGSYAIEDVAGEGKPLVGQVVRAGDDLLLDTGAARYRLTGPLARPRMAGPGYKVWVLGADDGESVQARRLGVLRPPRERGSRR